jgi:hypothetical protein
VSGGQRIGGGAVRTSGVWRRACGSVDYSVETKTFLFFRFAECLLGRLLAAEYAFQLYVRNGKWWWEALEDGICTAQSTGGHGEIRSVAMEEWEEFIRLGVLETSEREQERLYSELVCR